jgi:hypothetical protein
MQPWRHRRVVAMTSGGSSAFSPASIAGLQLWLDASQIVGLNDGDAVGTWSDLSGNGHDLVQATSSKRPTYRANELNGNPVVQYDGVDDYMSCAGFSVSQPCTWFAVVKRTGGASQGFLVDALSGSDRQALYYVSSAWNAWAGITLTQTGTSGAAWKSIQAVFNSSSSSITVGGVTASGNVGVQNLSGGLIVGEAVTLAGYAFGGQVAELGCYTGVLSAGNLALLQEYLNSKYGL